ncbi:MAG: hypothetical protein Q9218_003749 [Villophora microphyllina]
MRRSDRHSARQEDDAPTTDLNSKKATAYYYEADESYNDLSRSSTLTGHTSNDELRYTDLPKIPIRRRHLASDINALGLQFVATMQILKRNIAQRAFRRFKLTDALQQHFHVVHLHTNLDLSISDLYSSLNDSFLKEGTPWGRGNWSWPHLAFGASFTTATFRSWGDLQNLGAFRLG